MTHMCKLFAATAFAAALAASSAQAAVVFSDNFDAEHGGTSSLNYAGFANWNVTGQVDLVTTPDYGIICPGSCVDLDGTAGPGTLSTINTFHFNAGDHVVLTFDMSGNQRRNEIDQFTANMIFVGNATVDTFTLGGSFGASSFGSGLISNASVSRNLAWTDPLQNYQVSFNALSAGDVRLAFGTNSGDNVGPVLDNVSLSVTGGVPEPATWAMMITGFGMAGAALRRRRALAA